MEHTKFVLEKYEKFIARLQSLNSFIGKIGNVKKRE
jgi:hypothetical protein